MAQPSQQPLPATPARPAAAWVDPGAHRPAPDDDFALGCECADPSLQIEQWRQEVIPFAASSS